MAGNGQLQKLPWFSPGFLGLQNLLQVEASPSELPRYLLPVIISELDQPPLKSPQSLLCRLEAPLGAVLASSWEPFIVEARNGPGVLCSAKVGNLGGERSRNRRFAWLEPPAKLLQITCKSSCPGVIPVNKPGANCPLRDQGSFQKSPPLVGSGVEMDPP